MLLESILKKIFGDPNAKELKNIQVIVDKINALEPEMQALSSANLAAKTGEFKLRLAKGETLDDILPEAFAVVRETSRRITGMRHFDVQLIGGVVLHRGKIAEMRTGEGKTLVATLPAYLNALTGKGVHVVTVNDYLARRDSEDMGRIYRALGLSVGLIVHDMDYPDRKAAYAADITYGTNNEFGFDYLRDNMVVDENQMVQRELNFCIVDEVDSILIDEAQYFNRRSAYTADYFRPGRKIHRFVPRAGACSCQHERKRGLYGRRKIKNRCAYRNWHCQSRKNARHRQPL